MYNVPGYRPVRTELAHAPVRVTGELSADLEGACLRNGTNSQFDNGCIRLHAFSAAGMVHQIQISSGSATYSNSYVRTPRFEAERAAGAVGIQPTARLGVRSRKPSCADDAWWNPRRSAPTDVSAVSVIDATSPAT